MDGTPYRQFFAHPTHPDHRRYEALRAGFFEGHAQMEVAEQFGYQDSTLRQLVSEFRRHGLDTRDGSPFFESQRPDGPLRRAPPRRR